MKPCIVPIETFDVRRADGTTERILLRELSVAEVFHLLKIETAPRTEKLILTSTGRDSTWLNALTDTSYAELAKACVKASLQPEEMRESEAGENHTAGNEVDGWDDISDFVARICVITGWTFRAATAHTLSQLFAIERAHRRCVADNRLDRLVDINRGFSGGRGFSDLARALQVERNGAR
jgi:hypothetical protein